MQALVVATIPGYLVLYYISSPVLEGDGLLTASLFVLVISLATAIATFASQIMLGLNYRSTAALIMFGVNSGATVALVPALAFDNIEAVSILGWWALFSTCAALASYAVVGSQSTRVRSRRRVVSFREGMFSIPAQIGPWLFIFMVRYMIGINIDPDSVADFAITSTVVDMAFLVSVSILSYFSNRVMVGQQSPAKGLLYTIPIFVVMSSIGSVAVSWILPHVGRPGYDFSLGLALVLTLAGVARIHISAWRARALGAAKLHISSVAYLAVVGVSLLGFLLWPSTSLEVYAWVTLAGFVTVAVIQQASVHKR
ncbi:hypothetical protein [Pseudarthrobacter phenanthrenivorans]|uniref:hypothetical protein n=1 Tax=Pseudarthrobacter phenanthrenivorans TaxID=361575 RepID=UPI0011D1ED5D|nr:hypothetical protein [Pseudarthrobacter phenanthrenivorans]